MQKLKLSKNLWLHEYVDKETYLNYEKANKLHKLAYKIDKDLLRSDQMLRDAFGPVIINNWYEGGERQWSGLRLPHSPYFNPDSLHSEFKASDKIFLNNSAEEVRNFIKEKWTLLGITAIEDNVSWLHSDTRFIPYQKTLLIFNK